MKKISTLVLIVFFTSQAIAQFNSNWQNNYSFTATGGFSNEGRKVVTDPNGNAFVLTDVTTDTDTLGHPSNGTDYYVVLQKYNFSTGAIIAETVINVDNMALTGSFNLKASFGLELDAANNVYVGYTKYNTAGNFDVCVTKLNNSLNIIWTEVYSTAGHDYGVDLKLRGTLPIVLVKTVAGSAVTYTLIKIDGSATTLPALYSFATNVEVVNDITTEMGAGIFCTGSALVAGAKVAMTAHVNLTGTLKWRSTYNHASVSGDDSGNNLVIGADGDLYVSGTTYTNATAGTDAVVLRYNKGSGVLLKKLLIDMSTTDQGVYIENGPAGFLYQAAFKGNVAYVHKVESNSTGLLLNATASYFPQPIAPYTSLTGVSIAEMKVASSGNVYLCGSITGISVSGNLSAAWLAKIGLNSSSVFKTLKHQDEEGEYGNSFSAASVALDNTHGDILFLRNNWMNFDNHGNEFMVIDNLEGGNALRVADETQSSEDVASEISIYHNPASGTLVFSGNETVTSVEICDLTGRVTAMLTPVQNSLDISMLSPGIYLAKAITLSGVAVKRITVH